MSARDPLPTLPESRASKPPRVPSRPTHRLRIKDNETGATGTIGAGWANGDGSVSVKLDPGCSVTYESLKGKVLTLFPIGKDET